MVTDVSFLAAFIAGILSISSPCVLPLVPIYLAHMAGVGATESEQVSRTQLLRNALAYCAGFSVVFIAMGVALGAAGSAATALDVVPENRVWFVRVGGIFLIMLGLYQTGLIRIPWLDRDRRLALQPGSPGSVSSSFIIGIGFGAGWSPCIGPILGAILTMAAGQGSIERATLLLTTYTLGLAVPFLIVALAMGSSRNVIRRLNRHLPTITLVSGAVMLGVGVIMVLGIYQSMFVEIIRVAPWSPWEPSL
ncbi:MAG TPA: cytochrome c biogenesis CcdA family protein [Thermomicrobiales bacterium]|nr:cytochrome c biogenesis CcdA family protein [Thermomicrobiales bacterium]